MSNLNYRTAQDFDAPQLSILVNSAYRGAHSKKGWTNESELLDGQRIDTKMLAEIIDSKQDIILLGFDAQNLFGCVHLKNNDNHAYLGMLTIDPDLQANGFGKQLLAAAEQWIQNNWHSEHIEMTVIQKRTELIAWYEKRGYVVTQERRPFPYGDDRFGKPKLQDLEFVVLKKSLATLNLV
jgi:ribosomal protein S18 acetylase RimI-like enzyme